MNSKDLVLTSISQANEWLRSKAEPVSLVLATAAGTYCAFQIYQVVFCHEEAFWPRAKRRAFRYVRSFPFIGTFIQENVDAHCRRIRKNLQKMRKGNAYLQTIPEKGMLTEDILMKIAEYAAIGLIDWKNGRASGTVYNFNEDLVNLNAEVYRMTLLFNPLHPEVFPGVCKMEAEVVRFACNLFRGDKDTCGLITTGGTESIVMACKAYRDMSTFNGNSYPEILAPVTAHAAFQKAALMLRMRIKLVAVDINTGKVNLKAMKRAISGNTCMLVGSSPNFPYGVMDDLEEISKLGLRYNIPVHVDACLGGFLLVFMEKAGYSVPPFDFRLPGVTSISSDTHKYGYAPKGSSILMYRNEGIRKFQYFQITDWPGGIYATSGLPGSRAGSLIAGCWATMQFLGEENYVEITKNIINTTRYIEKKLRDIPELIVVGKPDTSVVAFRSNKLNVLVLSDMMLNKGWCFNPLQFPTCIHFCVTAVHCAEGIADKLVADVRDAVREIIETGIGDAGGQAAMYGMAQIIPDRSIVSDLCTAFIDENYNSSNDFLSESRSVWEDIPMKKFPS